MKKLLCVLMSAIFLMTISSMSFFADESVTPVIIVAGYTSSSLYLNYGQDSEEQVWGLSLDSALGQIAADAPNLFNSIKGLSDGKYFELGETIGTGSCTILEKIAVNPDGSSKYPLTTYPAEAAITSYDYLLNKNDGQNIYESDFTKDLAEKIGAENIFIFQLDFRKNAVDCAEDLNAYIKSVKEFTGSDKVNIFGLSHGGMTVGVYLSLYGTLGDVDNAVMSMPALGGSYLAYRILLGDIKLNDTQLIPYLEEALQLESSLARFFEADRFDGLDAIACGFFSGIHDIYEFWGSIWDFIPAEVYEQAKKDLLDPVESAELIEKSDRMHYEIMPNYYNNFKKAQNAGVDISILCSTGSDTAFVSGYNSDAIIHTSSVSGAKTALLGKRFSDGYTQSGTNCTQEGHNHVSPSMEIDASYAYLPENTWFVDSQYHGMYFWEDYTLSLVRRLLLTEEIDDIYSDPIYPQFEVSQNSYRGVYAKFDNSSSGYVTGNDTALIVRNLSKRYSVRLSSIVCDGMDLKFDLSGIGSIAPGEEVVIPFTGSIPQVCHSRAAVTVNFARIGNLMPLGTRTFDFTVMNGITEYDSGTPYSDVDFIDTLKKNTPASVYDFILNLGLRVLLKTIVDFFCSIF